MKKESRILLDKSISSLLLAIEHFNRPWDEGREEAVLILLDRSFELLLKSAIIHKGGKIREKRAKETIGFDKCVRVCLSNFQPKFLTEEEALTIQVVNSLRDAAQHYILDISEQQLYMYAQAAVTLYDKVLKSVFDQKLTDFLPERVLPISTNPPKDLNLLVESEFNEIKGLLAPHSRKRLDAISKLRALAIVESSLSGERSQPGVAELNHIADGIKEGKKWKELFPGLASIRLSTEGNGLSVSLRITKSQGEPVQLVPEGTPGATIVAVKRVNELGFYTLGLYDMANQIGISAPKCLAIIKDKQLQDSEEYFKEFKIGRTKHKRYSAKALDFIRALPKDDIENIWNRRNETTNSKGN